MPNLSRLFLRGAFEWPSDGYCIPISGYNLVDLKYEKANDHI